MGSFGWHKLSLGLAVLGIGVAGYLTYSHYDEGALVCAIGSCHTVQNSPYAVIAGIPISILGLGMYLAVIGLGLLRRTRTDWSQPATMASFAAVLAGTIYAGYLTYLELFVIKAICQWCVISAILTVGLLVTEGTILWRLLNADLSAEESEAY